MADGNQGNIEQQVLEALAKANRMVDPRMQHLNLEKATFAQPGGATTGLQFYDLEVGAKMLYPVLTPLRNAIPRVSGKGGIQANWRAVTAINTTGVRAGVSAGHRGGVIAVNTKDYSASYKGIGLESTADFEAAYAGQGFEDVRALAVKVGLEQLMIAEEQLIIGGAGVLALGTTPTPSTAAATSGGALASATYSVICVALTLDGWINGTVAGGIQAQVTRTNMDASSDTFGGGAAKKSNAASIAVTGPTGKITATVAGVIGASGYAWYWGLAGSELLGAITTVPTYVITAAAAGTQNASALGTADNSTNPLVFDGLISIAATSGSGSYTYDLGGGFLTSDNAGGIVEIDVMLRYMWDNYRLSPTRLLVNVQEAKNITKKIIGAGSNSTGALRFVVDAKQGAMAGGTLARSYLNSYAMGGPVEIAIQVHPNVPPGMIIALTDKLPYPLANIANVMQIRCRQDYHQIEWPLITRQYQYGVYSDQVLQHFFPPSIAILQGIGNG